MDDTFDNQFKNDLAPLPEKPQFLKILCILSFVCCGLMILIYTVGMACLFLGEDTINTMWEAVIARQPLLADVDRFVFFHQLGLVCVYNLIGNIFSLVGVIMMWRLNKIGFFIYAIAEIVVNFFGLDMNAGNQSSSYGGMIFMILIDLAFIIMYAVNLKHMNGKAKAEPA